MNHGPDKRRGSQIQSEATFHATTIAAKCRTTITGFVLGASTDIGPLHEHYGSTIKYKFPAKLERALLLLDHGRLVSCFLRSFGRDLLLGPLAFNFLPDVQGHILGQRKGMRLHRLQY